MAARRKRELVVVEGEREELDDAVKDALRRIRVNDEARQHFLAEQSGTFELPPIGRTLVEELEIDDDERDPDIDGMAPHGSNVLLVAQQKSGKSTLLWGLACCFADRRPFLGKHEIAPDLVGRIAVFNYEMHPAMARDWFRDMDPKHPERIVLLNLRGQRLPMWVPPVRDALVRWLRANKVEVWVVDPIARAWSGFVDNENDNTQVGRFLDLLDEVKDLAGVRTLVVATHTGRVSHEENAERSRGATRLEDHPDALWYLTRDLKTGRRSIRVRGRDVDMEASDLHFDTLHRRLTLTGQTRAEARDAEGVERVVRALAAWEAERPGGPPSTNELRERMDGDTGRRTQWIKAAEDGGFIERESGRNRALYAKLTQKGRERAEGRVRRPRRKPKKASTRTAPRKASK